MYPHALAILPFSARKGKNKRKKEKRKVSGDFRGFHRDNQGGFPFLFAGIKEK